MPNLRSGLPAELYETFRGIRNFKLNDGKVPLFRYELLTDAAGEIDLLTMQNFSLDKLGGLFAKASYAWKAMAVDFVDLIEDEEVRKECQARMDDYQGRDTESVKHELKIFGAAMPKKVDTEEDTG
jgi:hypothetical protein